MNGHYIEIPFNKWSADKLKQEKKNCTSRSKTYGKKGDWFLVDDRTYTLLDVVCMPLCFVTKYFWKMEGADNEEEFKRVWRAIHRGTYNSNKKVHVHFFFRDIIRETINMYEANENEERRKRRH